MFRGVVAQRQVRPPSSDLRIPPGPTFAPPAPRFRPNQPRAVLAKSGPARLPPEQFAVKSFGLPRSDQVSPPLSVRKSSYLWQSLAEHQAVFSVNSQAVEVVAASSPDTVPVAVCSLTCHVVPPSFVSRTSLLPGLGVSMRATQPRVALANRIAAILAWRSVVHVRPPSVVRCRYERQTSWQVGSSSHSTQASCPSTA